MGRFVEIAGAALRTIPAFFDKNQTWPEAE